MAWTRINVEVATLILGIGNEDFGCVIGVDGSFDVSADGKRWTGDLAS